MSNSDADYTSKLTGKRYRLEPASKPCNGCAFTSTPEEDDTRAGRALRTQRGYDCGASRGCTPLTAFKEITE